MPVSDAYQMLTPTSGNCRRLMLAPVRHFVSLRVLIDWIKRLGSNTTIKLVALFNSQDGTSVGHRLHLGVALDLVRLHMKAKA